jgi:hypothetical protein
MHPILVFVLLILSGIGLYAIIARRIARIYWKDFGGDISFQEFYREYVSYRAIGRRYLLGGLILRMLGAEPNFPGNLSEEQTGIIKKCQFSLWLLHVVLGAIAMGIWAAYGIYGVARS